jgi:very-short-patch-repair endonuclease
MRTYNFTLYRHFLALENENGYHSSMASKHPDYIHYKHENVELARNLRRNMTPQEKRLWYGWLRNLPFRFQRQKPIGDYIVDFYCHKAKLVIEIDGWRHFTNEGLEQDAKRTEFLETLGLRVLRFKGHEVDNSIEGVAAEIETVAKARIAELEGES